MKRKIIFTIALFLALISFGCTATLDVNKESASDNLQTEIQTDVEEVQEDTKPDVSANTDVPEEDDTDEPGEDAKPDVSANTDVPEEDDTDEPGRDTKIDVDEKAESYIDAYVSLSDDTEIEGCEWMQYGDEQVLRVKIQYKEQPENAYRHKEDYFLFITPDGNVSNVLEINYEDKGLAPFWDRETDCATQHKVGSACGFEAHFEDVTFDGEKDLLIFLGHSGNGSADACCAYIYENGEFRYERTFEHISYYKVDIENEVIYGYMRYSATSFADLTYKYVNGEFILTETVETYYGSINGENVVEEEIKTTYEYINGEYEVEEEIKTTYEYEYINGEYVLTETTEYPLTE